MTNDCPIDWEAFDKHFVGDSQLMAVLGSVFLDCVDDQTKRLKNAMASGEAPAVGLAAHSLRGSVSQVFAKDAQALVESIESRANGGQVEELEEDVATLLAQVEAIKAAIEEYHISHPPTT